MKEGRLLPRRATGGGWGDGELGRRREQPPLPLRGREGAPSSSRAAGHRGLGALPYVACPLHCLKLIFPQKTWLSLPTSLKSSWTSHPTVIFHFW